MPETNPNALTPETLRKETLTGVVPLVETRVKREEGKLYLYVDARGLHEVLRNMGVPMEPGVNKFANRPTSNAQIARGDTISSELLLTVNPDTGPLKRDLSPVYTAPPNIANLRALVDSANTISRRILEHYQPVDIVAKVHRKPTSVGPKVAK